MLRTESVYVLNISILALMDSLFTSTSADIREKIAMHLKELERSHGWLSRKTKFSRSHITRVLNKENALSDRLLKRINKALGTDFKNENKTPDNG